jgi:hypothetical protein
MEARPSIRGDLVAIAVLVITASLALIQSYHRWLDPIIDTGRDLYLSGAILDGANLYRDFRYQYPPLAPYVLAAITAGIGRSLDAFMAIGIAQSLAVVAAVYTLLRRAAGTAAAFTASLLFVALCFCGASTWGCNFLFPYSYGTTLGLALFLGYASLLHRYLFAKGSASTLYAAGALAIAAAWCKIEFSVAVVVTFTLIAVVHRIAFRQLLVILAAAAASIAVAFVLFHDPRPGRDWLRDDLFSSSLFGGISAKNFYAQVSGLNEPMRGLLRAFVGCVFLAAITAALAAIDRILRRRPDARLPIAIAAGVLMAVIGWMVPPTYPLFRAWAVLLPLALLWELGRNRRGELFFFALFAVIAAVRIPLNLTPEWYGFAFVIPTFMAMTFVLFAELPRCGVYSRTTALLWIPLFSVIAAKGLWTQHERFSVKQWPITTAHGTFYDHNRVRAAVLNDLTGLVKSLGPKSLVVMPEGVTLNYLTGIRSPSFYLTFTPPETGAPREEAILLADLEAKKPQFVAVVSRDMSEYGSAGFGIDYDRNVLEYVRTHYAVRRVWPDPRFQAVLLERK